MGRETSQKLTRRQLDVLELIADGFQEKEIATHLGIALGTVQAHKVKIYDKYRCHTAARAVVIGLKRKELDLIDIR
jgi:DNA-binding NarL/FixJ family response regulator